MPIIQVNLLEGRSDAQKKELAKRMTDAMVEILGVKREAVRVLMHEMGPFDFYVGGITTAERAATAGQVMAP